MFQFKLPDIGEGVHEGEIVEWLVNEGDQVQEDQDIVEVMTDKATVTISSPRTGTIASLKAQAGEVVNVGDVIIEIDDGSAGSTDPPTATVEAPEVEEKTLFDLPTELAAGPAARPRSSPATAPATATAAARTEQVLALPRTRKLARDLDVNLSTLQGSGSQGQITDADVQTSVTSGDTRAAATPHGVHAVPTLASSAAPTTSIGLREVQRVPLKGLRRVIAQNMAKSKHTAAHYTYVVEVDVAKLVELRQRLKPFVAEQGASLTYLPFLMKAYCLAIRNHARINSRFDEEAQELLIHPTVGLGIAVATPNGLVVPVVHDAQAKGIAQLALDVQSLGEKARNNKLAPADFKGGTFTITSLGKLGGLLATPVLNYPEVAIMGIHAIKEVPRFTSAGEMVPGRSMNLSFSFDHRLIDGAEGAAFVETLVRYLEEPERLSLA